MKRIARIAFVLALALALSGCFRDDAPPAATPQPLPTPATPPDDRGPPIALEPYLSGFSSPLLLTHDGEAGIVYVAEQGGKLFRIAGAARELVIDVSADVSAGGERGLLGVAFDPASDRYYLSYTDGEGDTVLQRVHEDGRRETILAVDQPYSNHNGGHLVFGPDGSLWLGLGDGGSSGDPQGNGQDPEALLGSLLRLDVSGEAGYVSPPDNFREEIWAKGLRNPWRFSFDRETRDLYVADVGQNQYEEVNFVLAGTPAGVNFGWNAFEGTHAYGVINRPFSTPAHPVAEYTHADGCSVTGGFVYRGAAEPALVGIYFLADYCSGKIWGLRQTSGAWSLVELLDTDLSISSFGEDAAGELFVVDHGGSIHRLAHGGGPLPAGLRGS